MPSIPYCSMQRWFVHAATLSFLNHFYISRAGCASGCQSGIFRQIIKTVLINLT